MTTGQKTLRRLLPIIGRRWLWRLLMLLLGVVLMGEAFVLAQRIGRELWRTYSPFARGVAIAPLFTPEVTYWQDDILRWSNEYGVEPNLLATVMQIESCGHPTVNSYAGAQGLFQVMPFHFESTEDMLDPDTNAMRGAAFLRECLDWSSGDVSLAMACYNGGPSVIYQSALEWDAQVSAYYKWGTGIYADALTQQRSSSTLDAWLDAGGVHLCALAATEIASR